MVLHEFRPPEARIAAVVLAAGKSSRMGYNKLLADLRAKPLLVQVVSEIQAAGVDEIVVVTGHMAAEIQSALAGFRLGFVHNRAYGEGLATSLGAGVAALRDFAAAFICLGDMPLVQAADMQRMMSAFNTQVGRKIIVPVYGGQWGHPVLWGQECFSALMALKGDRGARSLMQEWRDTIIEIELAHDGCLRDADTPEALALIRSKAKRI